MLDDFDFHVLITIRVCDFELVREIIANYIRGRVNLFIELGKDKIVILLLLMMIFLLDVQWGVNAIDLTISAMAKIFFY